MDLGEKRKTLAALQSTECGFQELPGGVWTWTCEQEPLTAAVQAPQGSAFALSSVMGLPFVRLRAALPEEFFDGSVGQALGRRAGLSVNGLQEAREDNIQAMKQLAAAFSCCGPAPQPTIPAFDEAVEPAPTTAPRVQRLGKQLPLWLQQRGGTQATPSRLVGTALALAFMSNAKTLSVVELARRTAAASAFFAGVTVPNTKHGFDSLLSSFLVMLSSGNLSSRGDWLEKARLWRLIFLQQPDGGWRMTDSLAFALEAHAGKRPDHVPKRSKLLDLIGLITGDSALDDLIDDALTSSDDGGGSGSDGNAPPNKAKAKPLTDCPLTFSATALRRRMPPDLLRVNQRYEAAKAKEAALRATPRADALVAVGRADHAARLRQQAAVERSMPLQSAAPGAEMSMNLVTCISILGRPFTPFEHPVRAVVQKAQPVRSAGSEYTSASESVVSVSGYANAKRVRAPARIPVERIWCTALALSVLEESDSSWLVDDEAEPERTVVDLGRAFLKAQSRESHRLRRLLSKGVLSEAAEKSRSAWKRLQLAYVAQLRDADVLNKFTALTHLQRASSRVVRSCMIDHSTFAVFLDTAGYLARWQRFMILITLVLSTLLTSIWFYCASAQASLAPPLAPDILPARRLSRCHMLCRDPHDPGLRPRGRMPRLHRRLWRPAVTVCRLAGSLRLQRRPWLPAHRARLARGLCLSRLSRRRVCHGPVFRGPHQRRRGAAGGHDPGPHV